MNQRAGLPYMLAEDIPKGGVEQVGGGVVAGGCLPPLPVHFGFDPFAYRDFSFNNPSLGHYDAFGGFLGVLYLKESRRGFYHPLVSDLSTAFGIEGRFFQNYLPFLSLV